MGGKVVLPKWRNNKTIWYLVQTDDELEDNICIKKYSAIGEGGKLIKVK